MRGVFVDLPLARFGQNLVWEKIFFPSIPEIHEN